MTTDLAQIIRPWKGGKITEPGLYSGVDGDFYHSDCCEGPSISSSGLRTIFNQSAAHYFDGSPYNPEREEEDPSEPFIFGRAAHALLLSDGDFKSQFAVRPEAIGDQKWNANANACKDWLAEVAKSGRTVLTPAQMIKIQGMARGLSEHPLIRAGILNGLVEHSFFWRHEETGVWLKARPDCIPTDSMDFADLKCVADISEDAIGNSIGAYGYNVQGALVGQGAKAVLDREMNSFSLVVSEKARPHCAVVHTLKPSDIDLGHDAIEISVRVFARCVERGFWPGPGGEQTDAAYIEMKPWHRARAERRIAQMEKELS